MIWVLEVVILLLFVGFGGFTGFIAWAVLTALIIFGRYASQQTKLKAAEVMLRAERNARNDGADTRARLTEGDARCARACTQCNAPSDEDATFCDACGASLVDARVCACGTTNVHDARFCKKCGRSFESDAKASEVARSERPLRAPPIADVVRLRKCEECGTKNRGDAYTCSSCGSLFL
jgi:hypothetical protein